MAVSSLCGVARRGATLGGLSPRGLLSEARRRGARPRRRARVAPAPIGHLGKRRLLGAVGERGACRRHLAVRDRAEGARLVRDGARSSTSPAAEGGPRGSSLPVQRFRRRIVFTVTVATAAQGSTSARRIASSAAGRLRMTSSAWSRKEALLVPACSERRRFRARAIARLRGYSERLPAMRRTLRSRRASVLARRA